MDALALGMLGALGAARHGWAGLVYPPVPPVAVALAGCGDKSDGEKTANSVDPDRIQRHSCLCASFSLTMHTHSVCLSCLVCQSIVALCMKTNTLESYAVFVTPEIVFDGILQPRESMMSI